MLHLNAFVGCKMAGKNKTILFEESLSEAVRKYLILYDKSLKSKGRKECSMESCYSTRWIKRWKTGKDFVYKPSYKIWKKKGCI